MDDPSFVLWVSLPSRSPHCVQNPRSLPQSLSPSVRPPFWVCLSASSSSRSIKESYGSPLSIVVRFIPCHARPRGSRQSLGREGGRVGEWIKGHKFRARWTHTHDSTGDNRELKYVSNIMKPMQRIMMVSITDILVDGRGGFYTTNVTPNPTNSVSAAIRLLHQEPSVPIFLPRSNAFLPLSLFLNEGFNWRRIEEVRS